jgi:hypothetical protein
MAREVVVDESPEAFDKAFERVTGRPPKNVTLPHADQKRSPQSRDEEGSQ